MIQVETLCIRFLIYFAYLFDDAISMINKSEATILSTVTGNFNKAEIKGTYIEVVGSAKLHTVARVDVVNLITVTSTPMSVTNPLNIKPTSVRERLTILPTATNERPDVTITNTTNLYIAAQQTAGISVPLESSTTKPTARKPVTPNQISTALSTGKPAESTTPPESNNRPTEIRVWLIIVIVIVVMLLVVLVHLILCLRFKKGVFHRCRENCYPYGCLTKNETDGKMIMDTESSLGRGSYKRKQNSIAC